MSDTELVAYFVLVACIVVIPFVAALIEDVQRSRRKEYLRRFYPKLYDQLFKEDKKP